VHTRRTPIDGTVNLDVLAKGTPGFSGADLENLVNEAALSAAKLNRDRVTMEDFEMAKDKVLMGKERRSLILSDEEKRNTAYHEAGHALVGKLLEGTDPVHKVSIIPRGRALGVTIYLPEDDRHTYTKGFLLDRIVMLLGGRVAEEVVLGHMTTGAGNDIERATDTARKMVCKWGMSEKLGPLSYGEKDEEIFLGRELMHHKNFSEDTSRQIDAEVRSIVEGCHSRAKELLTANVEFLHSIAKALLERETISGADIDLLLKGEVLPPLEPAAKPENGKTDASSAQAADQASGGESAPEQGADAREKDAKPSAEPRQDPDKPSSGGD